MEIVLDVMEVPNNAFVFVVKRKGGRHFTENLLNPGVGLDVFVHRFPNRTRAGIKAFRFPHLVELGEEIRWNIETGSHL